MGLFSSVAKAAGSLSGILGAGLGYLGQQSANATNMGIADANNQTSIELANTAYQRRVKDLIAAGLNPMLAYTQGGAQVPNLQQARVENSASSATRSGVDAAQMNLLNAQTATAETQAQLNSATAAKTLAETENVKAQTGLNQYQLDVNVANKLDKIWVDNAELMSKRSSALFNIFKNNLDQNTLSYLNDYAVKQGFRTFEEALKSVEFRNAFQANVLQSNAIPKSEAEAGFYSSDFGKKIAPFMQSGEQASRILKSIR